jgi:hypothetical protein
MEKLKQKHKQEALKKLEKANATKFKAAKPKSATKVQELREKLKQEEKQKHEKQKVKPHKPSPSMFTKATNVKLTTASILREEALLKKKQREQQEALEIAEIGIRDAVEFENWKERLKVKEEEERLLDMERKRLQIQLLHEETFLARQEQLKHNKYRILTREKALEVTKEKQEMKQISAELKKEVEESNKVKIAEVNQIKEQAVIAKKQILKEKLKQAQEMTKEKEELLKQKQKEMELEKQRKIELIQQIKLLEKKSGTYQKEVDLTESSGFGLLGEMSIIELQERLVRAKLKEKEVAEAKRKEIAAEKAKKEKEMVQKMESIDRERNQRRHQREQKSLPERGVSVLSMQSDRSEIKEMLLETNPHLKTLQSKILQKRQGIHNSCSQISLKKVTFVQCTALGFIASFTSRETSRYC